MYTTSSAGEALETITKICKNDPNAVIHIFGGDGSVFEAVNAVMRAGAGSASELIIHLGGTGNDYVRNFENNFPVRADLLRFGNRYAANEINLGFDCDVVVKTESVKRIPFIKGGAAYMISVLLTLMKPLGRNFEVTVLDENGKIETINGRFLLCLFANGAYYGGGFKCAPLASLNNGSMEFIYADIVSRIKFLRFFLGYKKGKHLLPDGTVNSKYSSFLHYKRIKTAYIKNAGTLCADGEIFKFHDIEISVLKDAISVRVAKKVKNKSCQRKIQ